ncbi:MAG: ferredoxin family protein [Candidatus Thorarchaeota archaeon]
MCDKLQFSVFSKRNSALRFFVPIDKTFRITWKKVESHQGHPVWVSPVNNENRIHGLVVGVDFSLCYGCGKCIDACPTNVFTPLQDKSGRQVVDPVREDDCILCLVCEIVCPVEAISIEREGGSEETLDSLLEGKRG